MIFGPLKATVVNVHDGDTLSVDVKLASAGKSGAARDVDLGFNIHRRPTGLYLADQHVRLFGCNAPELATPAGKDALAYLLTLVKVGDLVDLISHGVDKFGGRIDGSVKLQDGRDLTAAMIASGHAVLWNGVGPKPVPAVAP